MSTITTCSICNKPFFKDPLATGRIDNFDPNCCYDCNEQARRNSIRKNEVLPNLKTFSSNTTETVESYQKTCVACPAQWEGKTVSGKPFYIRFRHGNFSLRIGEVGQTVDAAVSSNEVLGCEADGDGWMDDEQMKALTKDFLRFP